MSARVERIDLGMCSSFLIAQDGVILIDAGSPKKGKTFARALEKLSVDAEQISLILITHGHWDHIGSAKALREMTGARIAMNEREAASLETGKTEIPPGVTGWGKVSRAPMKLFKPLLKVPAAAVDLTLGDEDLRLEEHGIAGTVIHTPGHTAGSVSVLLDSGDAFVGDLAMNGFPLRRGPGMPAYGDDPEQIKHSWRLLLERGAKQIHPAHGASFDASVLEQAL